MTKPETSKHNALIRNFLFHDKEYTIKEKTISTFVWLIENSTEHKVIDVMHYLNTEELESFLYAIDSCGNPDLADNLVPIECDLIMTLQDM